MREKSIQMPPRVAAKWPSKLVPPEYAVTGILRMWQTAMIRLTSSVEAGRMIIDGRSPGCAGCEDQSEPEWILISSTSTETLSTPTIFLKSTHAACRFVLVFWNSSGRNWDIGSVDVSGIGAGVRVPTYQPQAPAMNITR